MKNPAKPSLRVFLENLHARYHSTLWLTSDPLRFAHRYPDRADQEVAALIAAVMAFGNVTAMTPAIEAILKPLGEHPARVLAQRQPADWAPVWRGFTYRWLRAGDVRAFAGTLGEALRRHGSLGALWQSLDRPDFRTVEPALENWVAALRDMEVPARGRRRWLRRADGGRSPLPTGTATLLALPSGGSACKRLHLFLRWVGRPADGIDLGLWPVDPARLLMPVDTHLLQVARHLGLTRRTVADRRTVHEVTEGLRAVCPEDPVRYDFALVRPGILGLAAEWRRGR